MIHKSEVSGRDHVAGGVFAAPELAFEIDAQDAVDLGWVLHQAVHLGGDGFELCNGEVGQRGLGVPAPSTLAQ